MDRHSAVANPSPLILRINGARDLTGPAQGHAVAFNRIENGRVYFRDPYGPFDQPPGTEAPGLGRGEDGKTGEFSMSLEELNARFRGIVTDDAAVPPRQLSARSTPAAPVDLIRAGRLQGSA